MRGHSITKKDVLKMRAFKAHGFTHPEIATLMKLGESTIYRYVPQLEETVAIEPSVKPRRKLKKAHTQHLSKPLPRQLKKAMKHSYSVNCSQSNFEYITDEAEDTGRTKREVVDAIVRKHRRSWFNF